MKVIINKIKRHGEKAQVLVSPLQPVYHQNYLEVLLKDQFLFKFTEDEVSSIFKIKLQYFNISLAC